MPQIAALQFGKMSYDNYFSKISRIPKEKKTETKAAFVLVDVVALLKENLGFILFLVLKFFF